ncbi:MAG TPA: nucleotide exchange factor GrpE [Chitinophaga sp.]|jgi:molecular chaperone GrpE|uniref:nucleotide exchange factor GrpE n=1 Tax=Chitinophaga sp. TaxID=1869181 RepID=UPI002DB9EBB9|nr:nucleotide exchange factor GrpE [Chitinophaga sp.]HEU4552859.1 nucleotide exchange factor GrpE [Chitinophaga sp.]
MTEKEKDIQTDRQQAEDVNQAGAQVETENVNAEEAALDKKQQELNEMRDKYLRLVAEFDNFKKRNAKERIELIQTANKEVILAMLEVLDDADRAAKQLETSQDINTIKDGVTLVFNKLRSTLQAKGLKAMESMHTEFNADLHEAITGIPAPTEELKGKVLDELQKGYYLNDKLIRHARVVVGK